MEPEVSKPNHPKFVHSTLAILVIALLAIAVVLLVQNQDIKARLGGSSNLSTTPNNVLAINFLEGFVNLVLGSTSEISIDDRLRLENEVRALGDKEILANWQSFTSAKTDAEAQGYAVTLLRLLVAKIKNG